MFIFHGDEASSRIEMKYRISLLGVWISVLMGTFSLVAMIAAWQVDTIVNQDLYSYGLQLSYAWALPYWTAIKSIFAVAWMSLIAAIGLQVYLIFRDRKFERGTEADLKEKKLQTLYKLNDGSVIAVNHNVKGIKRLNEYTPDGLPMYVLESNDLVQVVSAPEKLKQSGRVSS